MLNLNLIYNTISQRPEGEAIRALRVRIIINYMNKDRINIYLSDSKTAGLICETTSLTSLKLTGFNEVDDFFKNFFFLFSPMSIKT